MYTKRRRATAPLPLPRLPAEQTGLAAAIPHIHSLAPHGGPRRQRASLPVGTSDGRPRGGSLDPVRVRALSQPRRHRHLGSFSMGEAAGEWHRTLRDGRYLLPPPPAPGSSTKAPRRVPRLETLSSPVTREAAAELSVPAPPTAAQSTTTTTCPSAAGTDSVVGHPPSRQRGSTHAERALALALRRGEAAATLQRLLVPLWRLYRHKQWCRAVTVARHYFTRAALLRRERRRREAADLLLSVLHRRTSMALPQALARLRGDVERLQRAVRNHQARLDAGVELNLRKIRRDVEPAYWAAVVDAREEELLGEMRASRIDHGQQPKSTAVPRAAPHHRLSYELDVYNYYMAGPMPELLLRLEIRRALEAALRRAATQALYIDSVWQRNTPEGEAEHKSRRRMLTTCARVPVFLRAETHWAIMDNVCFVTSQFREDRGLRAHLEQRQRAIASY